MSSFYKQQLNEWKATLDVKADVVFDIGGAQDPLKGMTKSWDVKDYKIVDLAVPHVEKQKPDIVCDMNETNLKPLVGYGKSVDIVFMLGVMDYVILPDVALKKVHYLLKTTGHAWVEFPFAYAHHNPVEEEGCRYSEGCIKRLAKNANLRVVEIVRKMERSGLLKQWYAAEGQRMASEYHYHGVTGFIVKLERG